MKLKIQTLIGDLLDSTNIEYSKEEYNIRGIVIDPYGEGTTDQEDQPCMTINFESSEERARWFDAHRIEPCVVDNKELDEAFNVFEPTYFVHFWQVPALTTVEIS